VRLIVDATGKVRSLGDDTLAADAGEEARETALTLADYFAVEAQLAALGGPGEVWHDKAADAFKVRGRVATAEESTRSLVQSAAQSAVGVSITALSAGQQRALLAVLLNKVGGLNADGTIAPLGRWAR
jgi:hypothetical protein